jgi:formate hydrogenlyase transcriptional activator
LVAATNADLRERVAEREFRADLYYRLNVFPIVLPPLRDRREDVPALVWHFTLECAARMRRQITSISAAAMDALMAYPWPGNIRELQNLVERSVIRSSGSELDITVPEVQERPPLSGLGSGTLEDAERAHILATLKATQWVVAGPRGAATRLGLNRSTLQFRMKKLGIERPALAM